MHRELFRKYINEIMLLWRERNDEYKVSGGVFY